MDTYAVANKAILKFLRNLHKVDTSTIFNLEVRGVTFNALPFLINGCSYASNDKFRPMLFSQIVKHQDFTKEFKLTIQDLLSSKGSEYTCLKVIDALLPGYNDMGIRDLLMYLYTLNKKETVKLILKAATESLQELFSARQLVYWTFQTKDLCNTQAFSVYSLIKWLIRVCPELNMPFGKQLRSMKFDELFESFIPEGSIHWKYIIGEISETDLVQKYKEHRRDGSVKQREMLSVALQGGDVDSVDKMLLEAADDFAHILTACRDYKLIMNLCYCALNSGLLEEYDSKNKDLQYKVDTLEEINRKNATNTGILNSKIRELQGLISDKDEELARLRVQLSQHQKDEEAIRGIPLLEKSVREKDKEIQSLFDERTSLKQQVSKLTKMLRKLPAEYRDTEGDIITESVGVPIEEQADKIRDLKIYIICGIECWESLQHGIEKYDLHNLQWYNVRKTKSLATVDLVVCITIYCSHSDVYSAEKNFKSKKVPIVYANSRNIDRIINLIYEEVV